MLESRIERGDKIESERRSYICSRALSTAAFADAVRSHSAIENWTLDVTFKEDPSRLRAGHSARNMPRPTIESIVHNSRPSRSR